MPWEHSSAPKILSMNWISFIIADFVTQKVQLQQYYINLREVKTT
jgi:hypothetical protein